MAVSSSRIEDLAKIKRDLVRYGGPGILPKIGLLHSNQYDSKVARRYLEDGVPLPKGYASERAIDADPTAKQFMLLTHSRLRNSTDDEALNRWNTFGDFPRDIVIYDESLLPADVLSFNLKTFSTHAGAHQGSMAFLRDDEDVEPQRERDRWLQSALDIFTEAALKPSVGDKPVVCAIPPLSEEKLALFKATPYPEGYYGTLDACLDFAGASVRILNGQYQSLASYEVRVHPKLNRVVILDASYPIRALANHPSTMPIYKLGGRYSTTLKPYMGEMSDGRMKWHSDVIVAIMNGRWGRSGVEEDLGKGVVGRLPKSKLADDVVAVITRVVRDDQAVLVFTYKSVRGKTEIDQGAMLREALVKTGVDLEATLTNGKKRINITTWGNETGTNDYAHCEHVILAGVLQLPDHVLVGGYLASEDNLRAGVDGSKLFNVQASEGSHYIYQALSRGACRRIHAQHLPSGYVMPAADRMTAWIIVPDNMRKLVQKHLSTVMRGVRFCGLDRVLRHPEGPREDRRGR